MNESMKEAGVLNYPGHQSHEQLDHQASSDSSSVGQRMYSAIPEPRNDTGLLEPAMWFARNGFRIHPLMPGTKNQPRWPGWQNRATRDLNEVHDWWRWHKADNIAVATGTGVMVIDLDVKHGVDGTASFKSWLDEHFGVDLPVPPAVTHTPTGGLHLWYRAGGPVKTCAGWRPGVDVRGEGGYVVAPPSAIRLAVDDGTHRATEDVWLEYRLARGTLENLPLAPDVLLAAINTEGGSSTTASGSGGAQGHLDQGTEHYRKHGFRLGERDPGFQSLAWRLVRNHYPHLDLVRQIAYEVWLMTDNPPDDPFPWSEVETKINRAWSQLAPQIRAEYEWARRVGARNE